MTKHNLAYFISILNLPLKLQLNCQNKILCLKCWIIITCLFSDLITYNNSNFNKMIVRSVDPGGGVPQQSIISQQQQQILRTGQCCDGDCCWLTPVFVSAAGQMVMAGQRLVTPNGGQVLMARPQQQGQLVRTSTGQLVMQQQPQQQQLSGQTVIRQQVGAPQATAAAGGLQGVQKVVISQPGLRPGQPGSQITVPLSTLQVESRAEREERY